jgi:hypothetical protein
MKKRLITAHLLAIVAVLLLAGTALATTPARPTAKTPTGAITQTKPTFRWSAAEGAQRYELRVYKGTKLVYVRTQITGLSHKGGLALPKNVTLTWKVRAGNAAGNGPWSRSLTFRIGAATSVKVGDPYQGGQLGYLLQPGDVGYVAGQMHGLVVATKNQGSSYVKWDSRPFVMTGASDRGLGWGPFNTDEIIAAQGPQATSYAAGLAKSYRGGGYSDWFLPSYDELAKICLHNNLFQMWGTYWSSSELGIGSALVVEIPNEFPIGLNKDAAGGVRPVRAF